MAQIGEAFEKLVSIMTRLRSRPGGCPWDLEQSHQSLKPYAIEEAHEVVEAVDQGPQKLCEELGDLLLQVVFHAQIACEEKTFDITKVINAICEKLIRRHPHVFGEVAVTGSSEVLKNWEAIKKTETPERKSSLDGVPLALPALQRAQRLGEKAARVGFDWSSSGDVPIKIREELDEFISASHDGDRVESAAELGDVLFSIAQWSRKLGVDAEEALRGANRKFHTRFVAMEEKAGRPLSELNNDQREDLWESVKKSKSVKK